MRRHTLIFMAALLLAGTLMSVFFPIEARGADEFIATSQAERIAYAKKQNTLYKLTKCLNTAGQRNEFSVSSLKFTDLLSDPNMYDCDVLRKADKPFVTMINQRIISDNLKMPATEIIGSDPMTFMVKMGYKLNAAGDKLVYEGNSFAQWGGQILNVYNHGKPADINNIDVKYVTLQSRVMGDRCALKNPVPVASIKQDSENYLRLNAAKNKTRYDKKDYVVVKALDDNSTIETLYHINVGGKDLTDCRSDIDELNSVAEAVMNRIGRKNQSAQDDALASSLYASLCPASDFQIPPDPAAGRTMSTVDTAAQEACRQKVRNCTVAEGPGIPRDPDGRKKCLERAFPNKSTETIKDAYTQAESAASQSDQIKNSGDAGAGSGGEGEPDCGNFVDGIGWFVCPALNGIAGINDWMWGFVSDLLIVNPLRTEGQGDEIVYKVWGALRNVANALLTIIFLIVIYGQLTGGVSNYTIKKMLPRIIIMAIAINISYYLVAIIFDIFNILGQSLYDMITGLVSDSGAEVNIKWSQLIGVIVAGGVAATAGAVGIFAAGGASAALIMLLPAAAITFLGFLVAILTLMVRQALIPILAILSPIAFVAYILPNTEHWFKKWWSMLISMLSLFPLAALLFAGVQVSAWIVVGDGTNWLSLLIALMMMGAPLFMLPFIARQSGPLLGKLGGAMNGLAGKVKSPLAGVSKKRAEAASANYMAQGVRYNKRGKPILRDRIRSRRQQSDTNERTRQARIDASNASVDARWASHAASDPELKELKAETMDNQAAVKATDAVHQQEQAERLIATEGGNITDKLGAAGSEAAVQSAVAAAVSRATADAIKEAELSINTNDISAIGKSLTDAIKAGDSVKARAYQNKLYSSGGLGVSKFRDVVGGLESSPSAAVYSDTIGSLRSNALNNHSSMKSSAADQMAWAGTSQTMSQAASSHATWRMSDNDFMSQNWRSQELAISSGAISGDQAARIVGDEGLRTKIDPNVRASFERLAATAPAAAAPRQAVGAPPATPPAGPPASPPAATPPASPPAGPPSTP